MTDQYERLVVALAAFAAVFIEPGEVVEPYVGHLRERPLLKRLFDSDGRTQYEACAFWTNALLTYALLAYVDAMRISFGPVAAVEHVAPPSGTAGTLFFYVIAAKYVALRCYRGAAQTRTTGLPIAALCLLAFLVLTVLTGALIVALANLSIGTPVLACFSLTLVFCWFSMHLLWATMLCSDLRNGVPPPQTVPLPMECKTTLDQQETLELL